MKVRSVRGPLIALILLALALCALAGCGSPSSTTGTSSTSSSTAGSPGSGEAASPAEGFSKNATQSKFGEEASSAEREQASEILEESLSARAAGEFQVQCETLALAVLEGIEENGNTAVGKRTCAQTLEAESKQAPPGLLENPMEGPIAALRKEGNAAYALFHGRKEADYSMRMLLENGEWKVAATLTEGIPKN